MSYYERNKEYFKLRSREQYENNKVKNKELYKNSALQYYYNNHEERKEYYRGKALEYYYKHREERMEYNRQYWKDNYNILYIKRMMKKFNIKVYNKVYYETSKQKSKVDVYDVYNIFLKRDNPLFNKGELIIKCYFD